MQALFLYHAGHGGKRHQGGHQEEKHRKYGGDVGDALGVAVIAGKTYIIIAVSQNPLALFNFPHIAFCIQNLLPGIVQLCLCLGFALFVCLFAVGQFPPAVFQLNHPIGILLARIRQLGLCGIERCLGRGNGLVQLLLAGLQVGQFLRQLCLARVQRGLLCVQLGKGLVQCGGRLLGR